MIYQFHGFKEELREWKGSTLGEVARFEAPMAVIAQSEETIKHAQTLQDLFNAIAFDVATFDSVTEEPEGHVSDVSLGGSNDVDCMFGVDKIFLRNLIRTLLRMLQNRRNLLRNVDFHCLFNLIKIKEVLRLRCSASDS